MVYEAGRWDVLFYLEVWRLESILHSVTQSCFIQYLFNFTERKISLYANCVFIREGNMQQLKKINPVF